MKHGSERRYDKEEAFSNVLQVGKYFFITTVLNIMCDILFYYLF